MLFLIGKKFIVYLSGPLPGIILAVILLYFTRNLFHIEIFKEFVKFLLSINYFNLLPISPLDGGNIVELMFLHKYPRIQLIISGIGAVFLAVLGLVTKDVLLLILATVLVIIVISRIKNKDNVQPEKTSVKVWVRLVAALVYFGLWFIMLGLLILSYE